MIAPPQPAPKKRVLVIDDDSFIRTTFQRILSSKGYEVDAAEDGNAGLELATKSPPSLILCDVDMPTMDGYATLKMLRKNPATSFIPFIFVTGYGDTPQVRKGMQLGADDFLSKPCTMEELLGAVRSRLEKHESVMRYFEQKEASLRETVESALPHELRTPLIGILGFSTALLEDGVSMSPQEAQQAIQHIHTSAQRLHRLIEKFIFKIELDQTVASKGGPDERATLSAAAIVRQAATEQARQARRDADLILRIEDDAPLPLPPVHWRWMVDEIIENAFKFSELGSPVSVRASRAGGRYSVAVGNRGRGLTPAQIAAIGAHVQFDRDKFEQQGCGLGLSIVKRLADLHGGGLEIESVPGEATSVRVWAPVSA
jgi:CheY-like chemotaxis protein/two-component sensor histidine kinase